MATADNDFMESFDLEVLVPQATEIDIEEVFANGNGSLQANAASLIEQRSLLYFDESLPVFIALRTPYKDEAHLQSYLNRLAINLEAQAYGFQPRASDDQDGSKETSPSRNEDTLWSGNIDTSKDPMKIVQEKNEHESGRCIFAIWRTIIPLCRPRMRLQSPMIVFKPSATLQPRTEGPDDKIRDPILQSAVPASINLLESLKGDPALHGAAPKLSAAKLTSVKPSTYSEATSDSTLRLSAQKAFRAVPAISSRVRYSRLNGYKGKSSVIASLDIETAPFSKDSITIIEIDMQLSEGSIEKLGDGHAPALPLNCRAKDNPIFLYRLIPNDALYNSSSSSSARTVLITVYASVLVSDTCHPTIEMRWKTGVDFSTALNPTYGTPGQSMQRPRRPSSLSRTSAAAAGSRLPASSGDADSSAKSGADQARDRAVSMSDFGVSVSFAAPEIVQAWKPFSWDVSVLNRSSKPRQLVLTVIPKRKKVFTGDYLSKASTSIAGARSQSDRPEAVFDENVLYAMQKNAGNDAAQVISLSADARIGPLHPNSCLNTELSFLPLAQGYLQIEAIRVTDVISNDCIDVRDLPDIVAE